jgi:5-hydroxyisourate hydrolase
MSVSAGVTTHVLDATLGRPAAGVPVRLEGPGGAVLGSTRTGADGRAGLADGPLQEGAHRLVFDTGSYFAARGQDSFYPQVVLTFAVTDPLQHYHVPLLLSPYAYSTYRGS